jgi:RNA polymerase sigma factor (sigma-70 family)
MNTTVMFQRQKTMGGCASIELVQAFGGRIYSMAKHITQNAVAAEDVLIETFLEVCSEYQADENAWLRLVTIAARGAFSKLHNQGQGRPLLDRVPDSSEDLVVRELSIWGGDDQQRYSRARTTSLLEHGLRSLDPMCRTVLVLRDIEDTSIKDIATIVNRSAAAVDVCLLRARFRLGEMLTRQIEVQQR